MAEAFFWGMLGSVSLVLGAVVVAVNMPSARTLGLIMGFGSGVLISAVAFELVEEAASVAKGLGATTIGFFIGMGVFLLGDQAISTMGYRDRKKMNAVHTASGLAIVLGIVLDGVPESAVLGLTLLESGTIGVGGARGRVPVQPAGVDCRDQRPALERLELGPRVRAVDGHRARVWTGRRPGLPAHVRRHTVGLRVRARLRWRRDPGHALDDDDARGIRVRRTARRRHHHDRLRCRVCDQLGLLMADTPGRQPSTGRFTGLRSWGRSIKPDRQHFGKDLVAGLPRAIGSVPDGMAMAVLVGVNPVHGLYASFAGPIAGGLTSSTQLMVITTTTAAALAAGSAVVGFDADQRPEALFLLTVLAGIVMIAAGLLRLGRYTRFVSHSVMTGFLTGVAVNIICGQLGDLTGIAAEGPNAIAKAFDVITHPGSIDLASLLTGLGSAGHPVRAGATPG